jgi:hypothetical protein
MLQTNNEHKLKGIQFTADFEEITDDVIWRHRIGQFPD